METCLQRHEPVPKPPRMDIHASARGTRALSGTGRRSCKSQKRLAGTAEPVRVARPEAVGLKVLTRPALQN